MPGVNPGLNITDPAVIAAFRTTLFHEALLVLLIFGVLALPVIIAKRLTGPAEPEPAGAEPAGRRVLLIGFGNLWLLDGLLLLQAKVALGVPATDMAPVASSSPRWVQELVNWAGTTWSYHPVQVTAAMVWLQVGLGIWMLAGSRGIGSRVAGLASAAWGLVAWVFGESFGGIFASGPSWLSGVPGAALLYVAAGVLIALPARTWQSARLGRVILAVLGIFLIGMAVLQAWPGRGYWQGLSHGQLAPLAGRAASLSLNSQPRLLSDVLSSFSSFDAAHGFAVNLVVVLALAAAGVAFLSGRRRLIRPIVFGFAALCLVVWLLCQDLGALGGVGTDPGSMIPFVLLAASGYLALTRLPQPGRVPEGAVDRSRQPISGGELVRRLGLAGAGPVLTIGGAALILLGAVQLASAEASRNADPVLAESITGSPAPVDYPAGGFTLTDQYRQPVSLSSLHGKVILLDFVDPGCAVTCPPMAKEFLATERLLGPSARQVEFVGIVLSATSGQAGRPEAVLRAFDERQGLDRQPRWLYLTGPPGQLRSVWREYRISLPATAAAAARAARECGAGQVVASEGADSYVIDRDGNVRQRFRLGLGSGSPATVSSFAEVYAAAVRQALSDPR